MAHTAKASCPLHILVLCTPKLTVEMQVHKAEASVRDAAVGEAAAASRDTPAQRPGGPLQARGADAAGQCVLGLCRAGQAFAGGSGCGMRAAAVHWMDVWLQSASCMLWGAAEGLQRVSGTYVEAYCLCCR